MFCYFKQIERRSKIGVIIIDVMRILDRVYKFCCDNLVKAKNTLTEKNILTDEKNYQGLVIYFATMMDIIF